MSGINIDFTPIGAIGGLARRAGEGEAFNTRFQQEQQLVNQAVQRQQAARQARQAESQLRNQAAELNLRQRSEDIQNALAQRQQALRERQQDFQEQRFEQQQERRQRPEPIDPREQLDFLQERLQLQQQQRQEQAFQNLPPGQQQRVLNQRLGLEEPAQQGGGQAGLDRVSDLLRVQSNLQEQVQRLRDSGAPAEQIDPLQQQIQQIQQAVGPQLSRTLQQQGGQAQRAQGAQGGQRGRRRQTVTIEGQEVPVQPLPNDPGQLEEGTVYQLPQGTAVFTGTGFRPVGQ
jgi:hypothetical protein